MSLTIFLCFVSKQEMEELCQGDEQCLYDAAALGSLEVGEKTRDAHRYYRLLHENMKSGELERRLVCYNKTNLKSHRLLFI
jgi:hypothetical protein